ncbi:unnamed protein product, partial [Ixodes pacificus]
PDLKTAFAATNPKEKKKRNFNSGTKKLNPTTVLEAIFPDTTLSVDATVKEDCKNSSPITQYMFSYNLLLFVKTCIVCTLNSSNIQEKNNSKAITSKGSTKQ